MINKKYMPKLAKPRNELPEITMLLRPYNGKDVRIARFSGQYCRAKEEMQKHYWHSRYFSDVTFAQVSSAEALQHVVFDESLARDIFSRPRLNLGFFVRTPEGVYVNPDKAIKNILQEVWELPKLDLNIEELARLRHKSCKVNGIYLGENDFAFAPWESFRTSKSNFDGIPAEEFAEGGLARAIEHTSEKVAPIFNKLVSGCRKKEIVLEYWDIPKKPVIGEAITGYEHGLDWYFELCGNSYSDHNHIRENPKSSFYSTIESGGVLIGKLATNKGVPV